MKKCAHCSHRRHIRETFFDWLETSDGSKWPAKNPKKVAKTLELKEKLIRSKGKGIKNSATNSLINRINNDNVKHGAWEMEDHALKSEGKKEVNDIDLDTGASNHIFCDENLFFSISKTNKTVSTVSGESIPVRFC